MHFAFSSMQLLEAGRTAGYRLEADTQLPRAEPAQVANWLLLAVDCQMAENTNKTNEYNSCNL